MKWMILTVQLLSRAQSGALPNATIALITFASVPRKLLLMSKPSGDNNCGSTKGPFC
jgi:hypothetical protein